MLRHDVTDQKYRTAIAALVVLFLIGMSVISFSYVSARARDARRQSDLRQVTQALAVYYSFFNEYPPVEDDDWFGWDFSYESLDENLEFISLLQEKLILDRIPLDPTNNSDYHDRYKKFPTGSYGCRKPFYILQVVNFETLIERPVRAAKCPQRDFAYETPNGITFMEFEWGAHYLDNFSLRNPPRQAGLKQTSLQIC